MPGNSKRGSALADLCAAVKSALRCMERGNDFTTTDVDEVWEMIVVREKGVVYLSIKSWDPTLLIRLKQNFKRPGYVANFKSPNGYHLVINKK